tara:strand:+ start:811 stop:1902 length:1092 start_codon:yes stop_codon:yes gene_type:complete
MKILAPDFAVTLSDDAVHVLTRDEDAPAIYPAYLTLSKHDRKILAWGEEARDMWGRVPSNIEVVRLLTEGFPVDAELFAEFLSLVAKDHSEGFKMTRPRASFALRNHAAGRAYIRECVLNSSLREVTFMDQAMACAIGMGWEVDRPEIRAVLSLDRDWFEFEVIVLGGVLAGTTQPLGLEDMAMDLRARTLADEKGRPRPSVHATGPIALEVSKENLPSSLLRLSQHIWDTLDKLTREQQKALTESPIAICGPGADVPGLADAMSGFLGLSFEAFPSVAGHPAVTGALKLKRHKDPEALLQSSRKARKAAKADPKNPRNAGKPVAMLDSIRSVIEGKSSSSAVSKETKASAKKPQGELAKSAS